MALGKQASGVQPLFRSLASLLQSLARESSANAERLTCPNTGLVSLFKRTRQLFIRRSFRVNFYANTERLVNFDISRKVITFVPYSRLSNV